MTAQYSNFCTYNNEKYELIGLDDKLFKPEEHGLTPCEWSAACYDGYFTVYEIKDSRLYLTDLVIMDSASNIAINGIWPKINEHGQKVYRNIDLHVSYSGRLRLAKDCIQEYYVNMNYQKASAFKVVLDFVFADGYLVTMADRSEEVANKRGSFQKYYYSRVEGIPNYIDYQAFSVDIEIE